MAKTLDDVRQMIKDNDIKFVDFKLTDMDGRWRHLSIPAERLTETTMEAGIGFDGSNYGYAKVEKSDMVFIPVLDSAVIDPYAEIPTLSMIGDVQVIDLPKNRPFSHYPRNVAIRALEYMKEQGIADQMIIGPEFEFYIFDQVKYDITPDHQGVDVFSRQSHFSTASDFNNNGYQLAHAAGYHAAMPMDVHNDLRHKMCLALEKFGVDVKYHHPEVGGAGQMEIEVELADMLTHADNTMYAKYVIKNEAARNGCTATLMPKPLTGEAGNGMHVHMLLRKEGKPVFYDENGYAQLSNEALWFIGGMLKHARSLCAITNPSTNSYRRLVPGFEAPVTIGYAVSNRSAVVRIPAYAKAPDVKRFELRNPDATCNPYFAYSAILMAGLDGIKNQIDPHEAGWGPYDFNLFDLSDEEKEKIEGLPATLAEALDELEKDHDYLTAGGVFPEELIKKFISMKRADNDEIQRYPSPMEFLKYYDL